MNSQGINVIDLRNTLPNLKYLILSFVSSQSSASHQRKLTSHNYTIPNNIKNTIASTSNHFSGGGVGNSHSSNISNKNTNESHRRTKVGVT
jgi:hypothetical protein